MPRQPDPPSIDLSRVYHQLQHDLSARLGGAALITHHSSAGTAAELYWIQTLNHHLPSRYRAAQAFVFDAHGFRSRQIDVAIYDHIYAPVLFPGTAAIHVPVETVRAVFEVKPSFSRQWIQDASEKAESVRRLKSRSRRRIRAGLLAKSTVWTPQTFHASLLEALRMPCPLDLGCSLDHGSFHRAQRLLTAPAESSLQFFLYALLSYLDPRSPAPNLAHYWKT